MTINVYQRPLETRRSSGKSCKWVGEAIVNGKTYTATSRMAPANDIARQLVADGVPDAPMHVYTEGLKGCLVWRSFCRAAGYTFKENAQTPVKRVRWEPTKDAAQRYRAGQKQGVNDAAIPWRLGVRSREKAEASHYDGRFGFDQPSGPGSPQESRRLVSPRHNCSRNLARSVFGGSALIGLGSTVTRPGRSSANRQNRACSATSIHRSKAVCFIARLLPRTDMFLIGNMDRAPASRV